MTDQEIHQKARWNMQDIEYGAIDRSLVEKDEILFYLLASASFIESGSGTYARNLAKHFADRPEVEHYLLENWEPDELQHGHSLGKYVQSVWPKFSWQKANDDFIREYSRLCTVEALYQQPLELVARCVVEMGTSTYYKALRSLAELRNEPVLMELLENIRTDEVLHYKIFLSYFKALKSEQPVSRWRVARVLNARLRELRQSDSEVALRHVWNQVKLDKIDTFDQDHGFEQLCPLIFEQIRQRLPIQQAVRMVLKPLMLPHRLESHLEGPLAWFGRRAILA